jgi:hypothetical protein
MTNNGEVQLDGANSRITGGAVTNNSLIHGDGRISGNVTNNTAGELRASGSQRLVLGGASNSSSGQITLLNGGTVEFLGGLTNNAAGVVSGRGTLITATGLANAGQLQLSGGASDIFGQVNNNSGGKVIVSGGATTSFYNAVANNAGAELRVATGSTAVFVGPVTGSGAFTGSGTKIFESSAPSSVAAIASITGDTIVDGTAAISAGVVREDSLEVDGLLTVVPNGTNAATSRVNTLIVAPGGRLDLTDNKLIVAGGDVGIFDGVQYGGLTGHIASAYNFSAWDGDGIRTSMPDAGPAVGITTLAIATADETFYAGGTFGGLAVESGDVLIMYTYAGDLNLDGLVDAGDYGIIDNFVQFPGTFGYANGDINYDGVIDAADYGIIDNTIQLQGPPILVNAAVVAGTGVSGVTPVPEPTSLSVLGVAAACLLGHRSRRSRCAARRAGR